MIWLYGISLFVIALIVSVVAGKIVINIMQRGFNGMSLESGFTNCPLDKEGCFAVILLATCEITKNLLIERNQGNQKRIFWLKRLDDAIEGVNRCYKGYLPDEIHEHALEFHTKIEQAINTLLSKLTPQHKCELCNEHIACNLIYNKKLNESKICCDSCIKYIVFNPGWEKVEFKKQEGV